MVLELNLQLWAKIINQYHDSDHQPTVHYCLLFSSGNWEYVRPWTNVHGFCCQLMSGMWSKDVIPIRHIHAFLLLNVAGWVRREINWMTKVNLEFTKMPVLMTVITERWSCPKAILAYSAHLPTFNGKRNRRFCTAFQGLILCGPKNLFFKST